MRDRFEVFFITCAVAVGIAAVVILKPTFSESKGEPANTTPQVEDSYVEESPVHTDVQEDSLALVGERLVVPDEDNITVRGEIAGGTAELHNFLLKYSHGILHCYQKILNNEPSASGTVTLDVTVDPGGDVFNIFVVSSSGSSMLDMEVRNFLSRLRFPASVQGRYTVSIPLRFDKI